MGEERNALGDSARDHRTRQGAAAAFRCDRGLGFLAIPSQHIRTRVPELDGSPRPHPDIASRPAIRGSTVHIA
jgi:hypothetical protein